MKKKALFYVLLIIGILFFNLTNVYAKEEKSVEVNDKYTINLITNNNSIINIANQNSTLNLIQIMDCAGETTVLGNVNDPNSVAWLLQKILDYIRIIAPFLVLILSSLEYVKAILSSDDEVLKKTHKRLITRLILAAALFLLPTIVSILLNLLGFTSHEVCGLQ